MDPLERWLLSSEFILCSSKRKNWSFIVLVVISELSTLNGDLMVLLALQFVAFQPAIQEILENHNTGKWLFCVKYS